MKKQRTAKSYNRWGIFLILFPPLGLVSSLALYAVATFVMASLKIAPDDQTAFIIGSLLKAILGLLGLVSILGLFFAIPFGIYFLDKAKKMEIPETK